MAANSADAVSRKAATKILACIVGRVAEFTVGAMSEDLVSPCGHSRFGGDGMRCCPTRANYECVERVRNPMGSSSCVQSAPSCQVVVEELEDARVSQSVVYVLEFEDSVFGSRAQAFARSTGK
jgi:hypothetical protein